MVLPIRGFQARTYNSPPPLARRVRLRYHLRIMTFKPFHFFALALAGWLSPSRMGAVLMMAASR